MPDERDGGPAFPLPDAEHGGSCSSEGMSLRDYFAVHASENDIQAQLPATVGEASDFEKEHGFRPTETWARYKHADDMLKAREVE